MSLLPFTLLIIVLQITIKPTQSRKIRLLVVICSSNYKNYISDTRTQKLCIVYLDIMTMLINKYLIICYYEYLLNHKTKKIRLHLSSFKPSNTFQFIDFLFFAKRLANPANYIMGFVVACI